MGFEVAAQPSCTLTIQVVDSANQVGLPNAIISYRPSEKSNLELSYTDEEGRFMFTIRTGDSIQLSCSYLGYQEVVRTFTCRDTVFDKVLVPMSSKGLWMQEVVITEELPAIVIKQDTIIFQADTFRTGREVKFKDLLKNLPGVHVDRKNEITVQGKKVQEVLVEGERFFTGDAALAVKYLPADAVDQIEILEKYNEIRLLQGWDSGDRLALNVRLKKSKKRFAFGDISVGSNLRQRHQVHANSFYYSPKLRINGIGDYNTIEETALTSGELQRLIGLQLNQYDPSDQQFSLASINQFQDLIQPAYPFDQESIFGVAQIQQKFNNGLSVEGLVLGTDHRESAFREAVTTFVDPGAGAERTQRFTAAQTRREFLKLNVASNPHKRVVLAYDWQYNLFPTGQKDSLRTLFLGQYNLLDHQLRQSQRSQWHEGRWIQEWRPHLQSIVQARFGTSQSLATDQWLVEGQQIPTIYQLDTVSFQLRQRQDQSLNRYYVLGRLNYQLSDKSRVFFFLRGEGRRLKPNVAAQIDEEDLSSFGFGYDTTYHTENWVIGSRYLWQHKVWELKVGLDYRKGRWTSFVNQEKLQTISLLAPSADLNTFVNGLGEISLSYNYRFELPGSQESLPGILIRDYNQFLRGNSLLQPTRIHRLGLSLLRGRQLKGRQYNFNLTYQHKVQPVLGGFRLKENNLIWSYQNSPRPLDEWLLLFRLQQFRKQLKLVTITRLVYNRYFQPVNEKVTLLNQFGGFTDLDLSYSSQRQEWILHLEFGLRNAPQTHGEVRWFLDHAAIAEYRYFIGDRWTIGVAADWRRSSSKDLNQNLYHLNANLRYTTKKERFTFQLRAYNLLNQQWRSENSINLLSNVSTRYRLIPRFVQGEVTMAF